MSVLVTGGAGYIGSHTCVQLIKAGYTPIIIDSLCNSKITVLERIESLTGIMPAFYQGDIRDRALLSHIFSENSIQSVIHFAGLKAVGESVKKPLEYYDANVSGTLILLDEMRKAGVKRFIFSSSATVYGDNPELPYVETMPTGLPTNPYGRSKLMVEECLQDLQRAEGDWCISILRYFNPVGAHPSGLMGEDPQGIPNNLMPYIAQVAVGRRDALTVFGNDYLTPDGTGVRDYIHVVDLAEGHVAALKYRSETVGLHIYNLGSGKGHSVLDVIDAFSRACGKPIKYTLAARRQGDVAANWADATKAKNELGWVAQRSLTDMAQDAWRWQSTNPEGYPDN